MRSSSRLSGQGVVSSADRVVVEVADRAGAGLLLALFTFRGLRTWKGWNWKKPKSPMPHWIKSRTSNRCADLTFAITQTSALPPSRDLNKHYPTWKSGMTVKTDPSAITAAVEVAEVVIAEVAVATEAGRIARAGVIPMAIVINPKRLFAP